MRYAFDSCVLGVICHQRHAENVAVRQCLGSLMRDTSTALYLPAVADYELRRELVRARGRSVPLRPVRTV